MHAVGAAPHDPTSPYHEIAAEARMSELLGIADSFGFECLGDIGPAPPHAPLSFYVEYGPDPSEPELRLFIASSASPPKLPKASQPPKSSKPRMPRKPTLASVSKDARKAGIDPARIEIKPDGSYVVDIGKPEPTDASNPWLVEIEKATKQ
jgi:hypothetical protein